MAPHVVAVVGPTGSGKTCLGIGLAKLLGGEIVSADSMQIYRGMDIGTAKADAEEQAGVPHHMLDVASPDEDYSVARYVEEASACCDGLLGRNRVPVIVGGTGLYVDSLLSGRNFSEISSDSSIRDALNAEYDAIGGDAMLERLRSIDPERAAILHSADRRRIVRAIEVYRLTGMTITEHDRLTREIPPRYDAAVLFLNFSDRKILYDRIDRRVDRMVSAGLFDEVSALLASGITSSCTAMQAIGYKEAAAALRGEISREEAVNLIKLSSRRYAKRQITWFSRREDAIRLMVDRFPDSDALLAEALEQVERHFNGDVK